MFHSRWFSHDNQLSSIIHGIDLGYLQPTKIKKHVLYFLFIPFLSQEWVKRWFIGLNEQAYNGLAHRKDQSTDFIIYNLRQNLSKSSYNRSVKWLFLHLKHKTGRRS